MDGFTHLCVHSHYSFLGGTAPVEALAEQAAADGFESLALTDANGLHGAAAFGRACRRHGIRPIIGLSLSLAAPALAGYEGPLSQGTAPLVLLAKNQAGYRSLCRLSSLLQADPEREQQLAAGLTLEDLRQETAGLICLSGGRRGWLDWALQQGDEQTAYRFASRLAMIYGSDNVYLALEQHTQTDQPVAEAVCRLAQRLTVGVAAVQPVYCLHPQEAPLLRLLAAIQHNCTVEEVPPQALPDAGRQDVELHWLSAEEIAERFANFPQALAGCAEIAARCEYPLPDGSLIWPKIDLPNEQTAEQRLTELSGEGLKKLYAPQIPAGADQRLSHELALINESGFAPLFLIVSDIVRFARRTGIPVSSRGSVANSLVAYCAGITNVDPLQHNLYFERFLNPARADIPDIDIDFCSRRRDEILAYVRATYGADHVALVGTISTMRMRSAVRETAKAYGLQKEDIDRLVKDLPRHYHHRARGGDKRTAAEIIGSQRDPRLQQIIDDAQRIVGLPHHMGVHPGAVVITPEPLTDILPLQWAVKGFLTTQFDFRYIEELGLPKLDLLGVSALTVLADAAQLVREHHDPNFDLESIDLNDTETAEMISQGETVGVFQCESRGARSTLHKLKAHTITDMAVANAFFKPGPGTGGMARSFVRRYRGQERVSYLHPALKPVLGSTKGVLIFQEQILRVAREIAGLSWQQANQLRRGMSKMKSKEMTQTEEAFIEGCQRPAPQGPGLSPEQAQQLWDQVVAFSGYGFNQGHATAYAAVSYRMAYLKRHYPAATLCARLANWGGFHHPAIYMIEAARLGCCIRPPHVNYSQAAFTLAWQQEKPVLWMGLGQVQNLRHKAVQEIITARRADGPFTSLRDLLWRVTLQAKEIDHLIRCGALDGLGSSRVNLLAEAEQINRAHHVLQLSLFQTDSESLESAADDLLQTAAWEKKLLGYPLSLLQNPLFACQDRLPSGYVSLSTVEQAQGQRSRLSTAGLKMPGWTGGEGFYLWDGQTWVIAQLPENVQPPASWTLLSASGRWRCDEWGFGWLQIDAWHEIG